MGVGAIACVLGFVTLISPDWIEFVSGYDPDRGDGSVERLIVIGLFLVTIVMFALAAREWLQPRKMAAAYDIPGCAEPPSRT
jgi:hypothetical protein